MDGFTGLNPNQAKNDISEFAKAMVSVQQIFERGGFDLFGKLKSNWFSPKAVEFSNQFSSSLFDVTVRQINETTRSLCSHAVDAFNSIARANGFPLIGDGMLIANVGGDSFGILLEAGPNGSVGMSEGEVRNAVAEYNNALSHGLQALDSVPNRIALYDQSGQLQAIYSQAIEKLKSEINMACRSAIDSLNRAISTEQSTLSNAASNASSSIGSVSSSIGGFGAGTGTSTGVSTSLPGGFGAGTGTTGSSGPGTLSKVNGGLGNVFGGETSWAPYNPGLPEATLPFDATKPKPSTPTAPFNPQDAEPNRPLTQ